MAPKNTKTKALCLVTAWMDAVKIPYELATDGGCDLRVRTRTGSILDVVVPIAYPYEAATPEQVVVLAREITSAHRPTAMQAFHLLTSAAGYGEPVPVYRGVELPPPPGRKTNRPYGDDPDLTIIRHRQFRQVPNPSDDVYKKLDGVITTACRFFFHKNREACVRLGYEVSDLKSYAQVWTANFWGTGRVINPQKDENERLLYRFLRQRFAEFHSQMMTQRSRNVLMDKQSVAISLGIEFLVDSDCLGDQKTAKAVSINRESSDEDDKAEMEEYKAKRCALDTSTERSRRQSAAELLSKSLAEMPHDVLVETLVSASKSSFFCPDTRREAARQLKHHVENCSICSPPVDERPVQKEEDACGVDAGSVAA